MKQCDMINSYICKWLEKPILRNNSFPQQLYCRQQFSWVRNFIRNSLKNELNRLQIITVYYQIS